VAIVEPSGMRRGFGELHALALEALLAIGSAHPVDIPSILPLVERAARDECIAEAAQEVLAQLRGVQMQEPALGDQAKPGPRSGVFSASWRFEG
jgi:hypothetical protein